MSDFTTSLHKIALVCSEASMLILLAFFIGKVSHVVPSLPAWNGSLSFPIRVGLVDVFLSREIGGYLTFGSFAGLYVWHIISAVKLPGGTWSANLAALQAKNMESMSKYTHGQRYVPGGQGTR